MSEALKDITIIGGGPTGLFASFYSGLRGVSTRIIDTLTELGGQLTALYPAKYIFDVGGLPKILGKDLAAALVRQGLQFGPEVVLGEEVLEIHRAGEAWRLLGRHGEYLTRAMVICSGRGALEPRGLDAPGYDRYLGRGVIHAVRRLEELADRRLLVVGGGDSAVDWALDLKDRARQLTLIHRRSGFRAHEKSLDALFAAREAGELDVRTFHEVRKIGGDEVVRSVTIYDNRTGRETTLEVDVVVAMLGFKPDLGPMRTWGLELEGDRIVVGPLMETNLLGIYAAGDVTAYRGKLDLIATGFAEAAVAVNNAVHYLNPEARVNPGHSTHLKVFKGV